VVEAVATEDGAVLAWAVADLPRKDLAEAGIGDDHHAFSLLVEDRLDMALLRKACGIPLVG